MRFLLAFFLLLTGWGAVAQVYTLQGRVMDEHSRSLPDATVLVLLPRDSIVVAHAVTNEAGVFTLKATLQGYYILKISSLGYVRHMKSVPLHSTVRVIDLGSIMLRPATIGLTDVIVKGSRPVVVKQDTIEYNADSFAPPPNANVEHLLKLLPGVELTPEGTVQAQGQIVTRLFVDGKELYGSNLQTAIRSLPADAINKLQLVERKSQEARFSGVDDGQREKVINVILKDERHHMGYGKVSVAGGTHGNYAALGNFNKLHDDNLLTFTAATNNVNGLDLVADAGGGTTRPSGTTGQHGRVATSTGGISGYRQLSDATYLNASYLFKQAATDITSTLARQNFLPSGTSRYNENNQQTNTNNLHMAETTLENAGKLNTFRLTTSLDYLDSRSNTTSQRASYATTGTLVNVGELNTQTHNTNLDLSASSFFGHRFGKSRRRFTNTNVFGATTSDADGFSHSFTRFSDGMREDTQLQQLQTNRNLNLSVGFSYREPLGKAQYLEARYTAAHHRAQSNLEIFTLPNGQPQLDPNQSRQTESEFMYQLVGLTYRLNKNNLSVGLGVNAQDAVLTGKSQAFVDIPQQHYQTLLPNGTLTAQFTQSTRLNVNYSTSIHPPTISQIQPLVLRYDPLNLYLSNANLRPEYQYQGQITFSTAHAKSSFFLNVNLDLSSTSNAIIAAVSLNPQLVRTVQYVNVPENQSAGISLTLTLPLKKLNSRLELSPFVRRSRSYTLLNSVSSTISQQVQGGSVSYTYRFSQAIDFNLRSSLNVTDTRYELTVSQNRTLVNATHSADVVLRLAKRFFLASQLRYTQLSDNTGFNQIVPIIDASASGLIGRNRRGTITLAAFNMLNRQTGATQSATLNSIDRITQNSLGGFYSCGFSYTINKGAQ